MSANVNGELSSGDVVSALEVRTGQSKTVHRVYQHGYEIGSLVQIQEGRQRGMWSAIVDGMGQALPTNHRTAKMALWDLLCEASNLRWRNELRRQGVTSII